ncbi:transcription initiation factor IID, 31kD subunit-domain-containing protein [Umbelopsis sp. PMI_123]|nr:transcription initiation factor IID, 31kD subunit-domain-containing protein [Umbelopsis sp. PMI_123]
MNRQRQQQRESGQQQPRDAKIISLLLQSHGVHDFDPKVVHQLLEFAHRYTSDVFQDALVYAEHAGRQDIDLADVQLAVQGRVSHSFTAPPPREFLLELAQEKNKVPLPLIPEKYGIRLPHEKHCLTAINFQVTPNGPPPPKNLVTKPSADENQNIPQRTLSEDADMPDYQAEGTPLSYQGPDQDINAVSNVKRGREPLEDDDYDD